MNNSTTKQEKMKEQLKKWVIKNWVIENFGTRCKTTDWEDFPEDKGKRGERGVCPCCEAWRCFDYLINED